jgi:hypothetical protein
MTKAVNILPVNNEHGFEILVTSGGRKLIFKKECLENVTILRKIDEGKWQAIAQNARTPYTDSDVISPSAHIEYKIHFRDRSSSHIIEVHNPPVKE